MENMNYTFHLTAYDVNNLLPQVSKALEMRTELISRERYPGLWKQTDKLNSAGRGQERGEKKTKIRSFLSLLLGVFLIVPGLVNPQELFSVLIVGILAIIVGGVGLWSSRAEKKNVFDESAKLLLAEKESISEETSPNVFIDESGMNIPVGNGDLETVAYSDFECVMETVDALLIIYGERITLLQKRDLLNGNIVDCCNLLSEKVTKYHKVI